MTTQTDTARPPDVGEHDARQRSAGPSILVTGSSGLVGRALLDRLRARGQRVTKLVRRAPGRDELEWDPYRGELDLAAAEPSAVVHLAGESIADGRWTQAKRRAIRDSRVDGTRRLAEALARLPRPPSVLVSASAIGFYSGLGDGPQAESDPAGSSFLSEVCEEWEAATRVAADAGIRVVNLRIGVVLARDGGALAKMLLPFRLGLGGRVGGGRQFMSWITLDDLVSAICAVLDDESFEGPVNATAPNPVTNAEFTRALGRVLGRPTLLPLPAWAARLALGDMADELLLSSFRVLPGELLWRGFKFQSSEIEPALRHVLEG